MKKIQTFILLMLVSISTTLAQTYNILDYGALRDTTRLSTEAIQKAIDDCTSKGGGIVWIPAGNYLSSTIYLKDNVTLHLDAGSVIYASRRTKDYPTIKKQIGASDFERIDLLLGATNAKNISLTGKGTLHCQAERSSYQRSEVTAVTDSITGREVYNAAIYGADYRTKYKKIAPFTSAINFTNCTNVHIQDVQIIESSGWGVHLQWSDRVVINGIYIKSSDENGVNSDGLDIDGCSNVMISNCKIDTGDDALCFKTTLTDGISKPCEWITVTNCILRSSSAAFKIGTESHSNFENITVSNCVINNANRGLNIIIRDGGIARNITFSNLVIHTERKAPFWWGNGDPLWFTIQKRGDIVSAGGIENINIDNIIAHGQTGVRLEGFDNTMKNIRINNFQLFIHPENAIDKRARSGFLFYGINELSLSNCAIKWDANNTQKEWEHAYSIEKIEELDLWRVKGEKAPKGKYDAFAFKNIDQLTIDGKTTNKIK